jgi:hypothetical protein
MNDDRPMTPIERLCGDMLAEKLTAVPYVPPPAPPPPVETPWGPVRNLGEMMFSWWSQEGKNVPPSSDPSL